MIGLGAPGAPSRPSPDDWRDWGVDPHWSRTLDVDGRRWHLIDRPGTDPDAPAVVCVHGNPTWSVLWAPVLSSIAPRFRVIAPDQLDMGYSERTGRRRFATRVHDLGRLLDALEVTGEVVLVGHDWGGAVAMGWAVDQPDRVRAMVLANTGIAVPEHRSAPGLIRLAARRGVLAAVTRRTPAFVHGASRLPGTVIHPVMRRALASPYRRAEHRSGVEGFVGDVPFGPDHPSWADVDRVAQGLGDVSSPVLVVSGARDPVFDDDFAADLAGRFPDVSVHRVAEASHLSVLHPGVPELIANWISDQARSEDGPSTSAASAGPGPETSSPTWRSLCAGLDERADDDAVAFVDVSGQRSVTFAELGAATHRTAELLAQAGVDRGDRIGVLVPPSVELVTLVYGCWRLGAVPVVADRGLGLRALGDALSSARPDHLVGPPSALAAARTMRWAPHARRLRSADVVAPPGIGGVGAPLDPIGPDHPAAVLFTSGATGPAKGVRYTHGQLAAQRDALTALFTLERHDAFVAAFAPFALYGPALGITSAVPDVDVTSPGTLTAARLEEACDLIGATVVFASPAALRTVAATASGGSLPAFASVRLVMSAGAPVPVDTLQRIAQLAPVATLHTPYGMTESLPVSSVDLSTLERVGPGRGVCVGRAVPGAEVRVAPLGFDAAAPPGSVPIDHTGELLVRSPWTSAGYDRRWGAQRDARPLDIDGSVWHRTGDVGHIDHDGLIWVEGRSVHVIETASGPVTPVPIEVAAESVADVARAAAVGIGPVGAQTVVVVVEPDGGVRGRWRPRARRTGMPVLAPPELAAAVRAAIAPQHVAAVCVAHRLPVDIRHEAKIDRTALAATVAMLLSGGGRHGGRRGGAS